MRELGRKLFPVVGLICAVLLIAGCGGESEETATSAAASAPTFSASPRFIKAANETCHVNTGRRAMVMELAREEGTVGSNGKETPKQKKRRADLSWTLVQNMLGELKLIKVKPADKPAFEALAQALEERIAAIKAAESVDVSTPKLDRVIAELGLKGCTY